MRIPALRPFARRRLSLAGAAAASALVLTASLSGCSIVDEVAHHRTSDAYRTADDLEAAGVDAPWVPADARDLRLARSTDGGLASLLAIESSPLDPERCTEVPRLSAPELPVDGAPDPYDADTVFVCGDWSVVPAGDGWYGWTPNVPGERDAAAQGGGALDG